MNVFKKSFLALAVLVTLSASSRADYGPQPCPFGASLCTVVASGIAQTLSAWMSAFKVLTGAWVYAALPTDGTDATPALNAAIAANPGKNILLPCARMHLITAPNPITSDYTKLIGCSNQTTVLQPDFTPSAGQPAIEFTPGDPTTGAVITGNGLIGINIQRASGDTAGIGLQLIQTFNFELRDVRLEDNFISLDMSGTQDTFISNVRTFFGSYFSTLQAGSIGVRLRSGYHAGGTRQVPFGTFTNALNITAKGSIPSTPILEVGMSVQAGDGVYMSSSYIGEAKYLLKFFPESTSIYLSNFYSTGTFFDGAGGLSDTGVWLANNAAAPAVTANHFVFSGGGITGMTSYAVRYETNEYNAMTFSGITMGDNPGAWCILLTGGRNVAISGNTLRGCGGAAGFGGIDVQNTVTGPFTISGNDIDVGNTASASIQVEAGVTAPGSIVGNSFGTAGSLDIIRLDTDPNITQSGNTTANATPVPNILNGIPTLLGANGSMRGGGFLYEAPVGSAGSKQTVYGSFYGNTASVSATPLTVDGTETPGAANCLNIPDGTAANIQLRGIGRDTQSAGNAAEFFGNNGVLTRDSGAGTTAYTGYGVPSAAPASSKGTGSSALVALAADTTNGCLSLKITAPNTDAWHWYFRVSSDQVQ